MCLVLPASIAVLADVAQAGTSSGPVTELKAISSTTPNIVVFVAGSHAGKPGCSTVADEWALSLATEGGRAQYALLLAASAMGRTVTVMGTGSCTWPDREAPSYITLN
jgi:hypothetical protein